MSLWTANEAREATQGTLYGGDWMASGVSIDSRTLGKGDLFIALVGPNHDGHEHVAAAFAAGASAALVHRVPAGCESLPLLVVQDTMRGLQALGEAARRRSSARIVAVTGSVGKTGTKEMLALALSGQGKTHWSAGSFNNHWGVPLSLARMPADVRFAVFELGMNHPGEIAVLTRMVRPHVAIITTIEAVHTAFFTSVEEIADAKAEIFQGIECDVPPGGAAVLNHDNRHYRRLAEAAQEAGVRTLLSFGSHIDADARLLDCAVDPDATTVFALLNDHATTYRVGVSGQHWAMNSLAVLLAVGALGGDDALARTALAEMSPPKGRGQRHRVPVKDGCLELIDESYNASPVSMRAAIATLSAARPAKGARRVAILGDMLELGEDAERLHVALAEMLMVWNVDVVHTAGPLMAGLHQALPPMRRGRHTNTAEELAPLVRADLKAGDVVVVKGSAGSRMAQVVKTLLEGC